MAQQTINVGTIANDGTGDDLRSAMIKIDANFDEVYVAPEGTAILSTGEAGGTKVLTEDGDGTCSWQAPAEAAPEGTAILSTGETGATKILTEDGDGTCSWQAPAEAAVLSAGGVEGVRLYEASSHIIMDNEIHAGLTAGTTQTQVGGLQLLSSFNLVSTVATAGDSVVAIEAAAGRVLEVINDGANTLYLWPAVGDDFGGGVNVKKDIEPNEVVSFRGISASAWHVEATTERIHASMYDEDNTDAFVISDPGSNYASYHSGGLQQGDELGWSFDVGGAGTSYPIASIADAGGGDITVTTTGTHGLEIGDIISQSNLADAAYVGIFVVLTVPSTTTYTVTATYTATDTGTMDQAATLECLQGSQGQHELKWSASATSATTNDVFDYKLFVNSTAIPGSSVRRKFGNSSDFGAMCGLAPPYLMNAGDKISFAISNSSGSGAITIRNFVLLVDRV